MKKRLNILCVIVLLVLSYSVLEVTYYVGLGIKLGLEKGLSEEVKMQEKEDMTNMQLVHLIPKDLGSALLTDSVYNEKSGEYVPASFGQMLISVDTHPGLVSKITSKLALFLNFIAVFWAFMLFIRLIVAINRSDIFNWKNVRRLRRLGILLIISFGCSLLMAFLTVYSVEETFSISGYSLSISDMVEITSLMLGLSALIVAEVFAIGLRMKEEQDLTI